MPPHPPEPDMYTSPTKGPVPGNAFVLLDRIDDSGQPRTSDVARSRIRSDIAKIRRAQQAEKKASATRPAMRNLKLKPDTS